MKYKEFSFGQTEAVFNMLGGVHGVHRFLAGQTVVQAVPKTFPIWRTIKVGNYTGRGQIIDDVLFSGKCEITENGPSKKKIVAVRRYCVEMLHTDGFTMYDKEQEIDLVVLTPAELGFKEGCTAREIYSWASQLGLYKCLSEVGIQLCFQPEQNPKYSDLQIAMKPIYLDGHNGFPYVFRVVANNGMQLDYQSGSFFTKNQKIVFHLSKKVVT